MSRIGRQPIIIPNGVGAEIKGNTIVITGPKGTLTQNFPRSVKVSKKENQIAVRVHNPENKEQRSLWGTYARLISNMITGVLQGYEKRLELVGVGFRASVKDNILVLNIGFANSIEFKIPPGIDIAVKDNTKVKVLGIDKQLVGETAARIRELRKPEPYKGKGIKYSDEVIRRKAGKKATAAAEK